MRTRADLSRAAAGSGMRLVDVAPGPFGELKGHFVFSNPWQAPHLLTALAEEDGTRADWSPEVFAWAAELLRQCEAQVDDEDVRECFARAIHGSVQRFVEFVHETGEKFQSARVTALTRQGDCDCQARLVYALARSHGLPADLVYFDDARRAVVLRPGDPVPPDDGTQPVHVAPRLGLGGAMLWAETTVPARFGENPYDAYRRLMSQGRAPARAELATP